jgi:hypothetical protein
VHFTVDIVVNQMTLWFNDMGPWCDGLVIFQAGELTERLDDCLDSLDDKWQIDSIDIERPSSNIFWVCGSIVAGREAIDSSWTDTSLSRPEATLKWIALVRHSTPWLGPCHGGGDIILDTLGFSDVCPR